MLLGKIFLFFLQNVCNAGIPSPYCRVNTSTTIAVFGCCAGAAGFSLTMADQFLAIPSVGTSATLCGSADVYLVQIGCAIPIQAETIAAAGMPCTLARIGF